MKDPLDALLSTVTEPRSVYLIHGDLVLAEPAAQRLAEALAKASGTAVETHRRPARLAPLLDDLATYSLFGTAKVSLVTESAVLATKASAAALLDDAATVLPVASGSGGGEAPAISQRERRAASRLLQVLSFFDLTATAGTAEAVLDQLPAWVLQGGAKGRRKRSKKQVDTLRTDLEGLLELARGAELAGYAEGDLERLGSAVANGLPPGHCLVLAESSADAGHPVVRQLLERGAVAEFGTVSADRRGGWQGLRALADQLEVETGTAIERSALEELARRTLKKQGRRDDAAQGDSTARLAGEYRKLAHLASDGSIDRRLVERTVLDRGDEDVFKILDAVGENRGGEALSRLRRYLSGAEDPIAARLSFFALLAGYCRNLLAVRGMMRLAGVRGGEANYSRFKGHLESQLKGDLPTGEANPLKSLHPYRLHRAYLAAGRLSDRQANLLPVDVLETELQLKGASDDPEGALSRLVAQLADPAAARRLG